MLFSVLFLLASSADSEPVTRYEACIAALSENLESGRISAQQWAQTGGGARAQHCLAIADAKAGFHKLAATRLEDIAERKDAGDDYVRARILSEAAENWLKAEEATLARAAYDKAYSLTPDSGELQITAAKVFAAQEQWLSVINAVDAAEEAGFESSRAYVLRGRAYFKLGDNQRSAQDVANALNLNDRNIEALILRGELQQTGIAIDVFYDEQ